MRKVLSFVLVLSLVLGSCGFAFATTTSTATKATTVALTDIKGLASEDAVTVLASLGVVKGYTDGTFKPANIVTRAEMAVIIIKALGLDGYATGKSTFKDMSGYDWAQGYVAYAQSSGIIAGYGDGNFKPGQTVSYNEAAKMLVAALGYTPKGLDGVWPGNYVNKAKDLGILDGITATATGANRGDVAIMTYQTLDVPMVKINVDNEVVQLEGKYNSATGKYAAVTLMSKLGVKDYVPTGATADTDGNYYFVMQGDEDSLINLTPYVGELVAAYKNADDNIIAIKAVKSTTLTGEYDKGDEVLTVGDVDYNLSVDDTTVNTDDYVGARWFQNGDPSTSFTSGSSITAFKAATGTNSLQDSTTYTVSGDVSGKTIKDIYSIGTWTVTADDYWDADYAAEVVNNKTLDGIDFKLDDNDKIDATSYDLLGAKDFASIPNDAVMYIYQNNSTDKQIARVEISTATVTGEITKVNTAKDKFTIDGVTYKKSDQWVGGTAPKAGDNVKFFLDYAGKAYDFDKVSGTANKIATVIDFADSTNSLTKPQLELMLADGTDKTFDVSGSDVYDKDGTNADNKTTGMSGTKTFNTVAGTYNAAIDTMLKGDIIKYDVNSSGLINDIEVLDTVNTHVLKANASSITASGYYAGKKIASDAVLFTYDNSTIWSTTTFSAIGTAALDGDDFDATTLDAVKDSTDVQAYYHLDDDGVIDAMVINSNSVGNDDIFGVVTDNGTNSSDAGKFVEVLVDGVTSTYDTANTYSDYTKVYAISFNGNKEATLDAVTASEADANTSSVATSGAFLLKVTSDKVVTVNTGAANIVAGTTLGKAPFALNASSSFSLDSKVHVYVWDNDDECYTVGTVSDLKDNNIQKISFYDLFTDTDNEDGVADLVLITEF